MIYGGARNPTSKEFLVIGSYPDAWVQRYVERDYFMVDPVVRQGLKDLLPYRWGEGNYVTNLKGAQRTLFDEAADFGVCKGYTVPIHGPQGDMGLFTVATDEGDETFDTLTREQGHLLHLAGFYVHDRIRTLAYDNEPEPVKVKLTQREKECLLWSSTGRTAWEISNILGISETTVIYYIENAKKKLGARTKVHAIAMAITLNLLDP